MTQAISKRAEKLLEDSKAEFEMLLTEFDYWRHKNIGERQVGQQLQPSQIGTFGQKPRYSGAAGRQAYTIGFDPPPIEPVEVPKGVDLEEVLFRTPAGRKFELPATSFAMQKNLKVLDLRLDDKGYLTSPKAFDPDWKWQSKAIWLRLVGMRPHAIAERLGVKYETLKSTFGRLKIAKFFPRESKTDWATIGYGSEHSPSGRSMILYGGSPGILYPTSEVIIDQASGQVQPKYLARFSVGERLKSLPDGGLETELLDSEREFKYRKGFKLEKHWRQSEARTKEAKKRKIEVTLEQKKRQIESLKRNMEKGFNPETGEYEDV